MEKVDLSGGWNRLWTAVEGGLGSSVTTMMSVIGVGLIVIALFTWIWKRRRSGGQGISDMSGIWWTMGVGIALASPDLLFPLLLTLVDALANAAVGILRIGG